MQIEEPDMLSFPFLEELHDFSARAYCLLMFVKRRNNTYIMLENILLNNAIDGVNG